MKSLIKKIVPDFLISWYHFLVAFSGALFHGFPGKKLIVIGITGTKGKSSVVEMVTKIFEGAVLDIISLSSIRFKIKDEIRQNDLKMTMPGRMKIQRFFKEALSNGCKTAILEVTSEGIEQFRHKFIGFEVTAFLNLSPEHIESHGSFENYREAKLKLFKENRKTHIINLDDENSKYFLEIPSEKKIGFTFEDKDFPGAEVIRGENLKLNSWGSQFKVNGVEFNLKIPGIFNTYNALSAVSIAMSQGVSLEICKEALEKIEKIEGRMEKVIEKPFKVVVDYAHTPDSLKKAYQALKATRLICVLGACGGGRDKWKRPEMGKIAAEYCDWIILTNEDPYEEPPRKILADIASGIKRHSLKPVVYNFILDRREAINKALQLANPGDTVVITGKGCEPWMCVKGGKKIPWDDRKIVKEEFEKLQKKEDSA